LRRASLVRGAVLALLLLPSAASAAPARSPAPEATSVVAFEANLSPEMAVLREEIADLRERVDAVREGTEPPAWAARAYERLGHRVERLNQLLERLAARVETPVPRLDEPFTLLTVAACMLILGFLAGRTMQRRSGRKDPRFRL